MKNWEEEAELRNSHNKGLSEPHGSSGDGMSL